MKLLEKGNWDNPWSEEMVCPEKSCGAKMLVEESDVKPVHYQQGFHAVCMMCGQNMPIPSLSLPKRVKDVAEKSRKYSRSSYWD